MNNRIFGKKTRSRRSARNQKRLRSFASEQLESRVLLAGDTLAWHNADMPLDTNEDGRITSLDALLVVNELNRNGAHDVDPSEPAPGLVDVNANGVISPSDALQIINHLNSGQGEPEKVQVRLAVTAVDSFDPVTTLNAGDEFLLRVFVQDIRDEPLGVFAAYTDVTYNAELANVNGDVQHCRDETDFPLSCLPTEYPNGITSPDDPDSVNNVSVDGELNEMGGFSSSLVPTGATERLLLTVPMIAEDRSGTLTFAGDPSDILPAHEINLFGESVGVLDEEIIFVNTSVQVVGSSTGSLTATNDSYDATEDVNLEVNAADGVLGNDDPSTGVTARLVSDATNGTVTLSADGSFVYDPADDFFGEDSFTYVTTDGTNDSNAATVTITVAAQSDAPVAGDDQYTTPLNTELSVSAEDGLLANDSDVDSSLLRVLPGTNPANGTVVVLSDGSFTYTPNDGFTGTDTFRYVLQDDTEPPLSAFGTVTIEVTEDDTNGRPDAVNDSFDAIEDVTLVVNSPGVLANDSDPDDDALSVSLVTQPVNGTVTLLSNGELTYVPDPDFNGTDTFTYRLSDGDLTDTATVLIRVESQDDAPRPEDDSYGTIVNTTLQVSAEDGVLANDVDVDSSFLRSIIGLNPENGTVVLLSDGSFTYTPDDGFVGTDSFIYAVQDDSLAPLTAFGTVTIEVLEQGNRAPNAADDEFTVPEDTTLTVEAPGVLENDTDADGDSLSVALLTVPTNGAVDLEADGSFVYTPDQNFNGDDTFTYQVSDGTDTDTATVVIEVTGVNDAPVAEDDFYSTPFETVLEVSANDGVLANDEDVDNSTLIVSTTTQPENGTVVVDADGSFVYTPDDDFSGTDTFTYAVQDSNDGQVPLTDFGVVSIEVGQPQDTQVVFRLATTDDAGNEITSLAAGDDFELRVFVDDVTPEPQQGVFAAYLDVEWDPSLAFVTGEPVYNDVYANGRNFNIANVPGLLNEAGAFDGLSELGGAERLLFRIPMQATGDGELTFTSNEADILPFGDVLLFELRGEAVSPERIDFGSTTLNVQGPTEPVAVNDSYEANDNGFVIVSAEDGVLANDSGPGGLTAILVDDPSFGSLVLNSDGSFEYEADEDFVGTDSFTYRALTDGDSSEIATVTITVGEVNPGSISGTVYFDTNNNGSIEGSEHAFGGVTVTLSRTDADGAVVETIGSTQTDAGGGYIFRNLDPGSYVVTQEQPAIVIDGIDSVGGVASGTNDQHSVSVGSGANVGGVNFGERGLQPAFFGNSLFLSSALSGGAGIGVGPDGRTSWFCLDSGWSSFRSVNATVSGSVVNITARTLNGDTLSSTIPVTDSRVQVIGNASSGFLVRLTGNSSEYNLQATNVAAVEAVFAQ